MDKTITFPVDLNCVKSCFLLSEDNINYKRPTTKFSEKIFVPKKD
jgi:hypothetical protein